MSAKHGGLPVALAAAMISGVAVYVNGLAVRHFPSPTVYTTGKNLIAGGLLVAVLLAGRRTAAPRSTASFGLGGGHRRSLVAVAVVGGAVPFVLFFEGLARASSTDAAFIHKTLVVWVAILAAIVLGERIGPVHVLAIALLVLGHAALAGGVGALRLGPGELMILAATLCWAVELVIVKRLLADLPPTTVGAARLAGGSLVLVVWVTASGRAGDLVSLTTGQWTWLALTGVILATFVAVWFAALARERVVDVTAVLVLGAVVTGVIEAVFGDGGLGGRVTGDVLILIGVLLVLAAARRRSPVAEQHRAVQWS